MSLEDLDLPAPPAEAEASRLAEFFPVLGHPAMDQLLPSLAIVAAAGLAFLIIRATLSPLLHRVGTSTRNEWDDVLFDQAFLRRVSWAGAAAVASYLPAIVWATPLPTAGVILRSVSNAFLALSIVGALSALLGALNVVYARREDAKRRPLKGYIQIAKIVLYGVGTIIAFAALLDRNPAVFFTGLGAMTAVLLLIFKDTILSLVASVQLTSNDMIRVGDWIEVPSLGVDGDIIDIALHTIKVRNFDKTIATIPTYALISGSFKNWRGMQDTGGRRIKRCLTIDLTSIGFLSREQEEHLARHELLSDYMRQKRANIDAFNAARESTQLLPHRRRLTNIGTFRQYITAYLQQHPQIHQQGLTFLVRQLQTTENGLPLEIYVFTTTTVWTEYEAIQADIFDHLLAVIGEFGLRAYQRPSGRDVAGLVDAA